MCPNSEGCRKIARRTMSLDACADSQSILGPRLSSELSEKNMGYLPIQTMSDVAREREREGDTQTQTQREITRDRKTDRETETER